MKPIDADKTIFNIPTNVNQTQTKTEQNGQFDRILNETIQETKKTDIHPQSEAAASQIHPVQFMADTKRTTSTIVEEVEQLMDTLDAYQQKLGAGSNTLKDIWPLVEKMDSQNESLRLISKKLEEQDTLTNIVDQCISITSTEIAKFNNGYYNDQ